MCMHLFGHCILNALHMHRNGANSTNAAFQYDFIVGKNVRRSLSIIHGCSVGSFSYKSVGFFTVEPDIVLMHSCRTFYAPN